jgi:hypothetical protein
MNSDLYSSTRRSAKAHSEQRTGERRTAVLASIRTARNLGRAWNVAAILLGAGIAALLSGFALWSPTVSVASAAASVAVAIGVAWAGAMLLVKPSAGVVWFALPIAIGLVCSAMARDWRGFGVLLGCILIPLISLALYRTDARRQT